MAAGADAPASVGRDSELVTIERPIRDIAVTAGSSSVEEILVKNQTARPVAIELATRDLATRRGGSATLAIEQAGSQPRGAGGWLELRRSSVRIEPFDQEVLLVDVDVPANASSGAWAGAVLLTVSGVGAESTVTLKQETSINFLFTVPGAAKRDVRISVEPDRRVLWRGGKTVWKVTVVNEGDAFESFGGRLRVDGGIGGTRSYRLDNGILFPGERRSQRIAADVRPAPDRIRGTLDVTSRGRDGADEASEDVEYRATADAVYVVPWWLPLVLLGAVLVIVLRLRVRRGHEGEPFEQYDA